MAMAQTQPAPLTTPKPSLSPSLKHLVQTIQAEEPEENTTDAETRESLETAESEIRQSTYEDVWDRMRQGFSLNSAGHSKVSKELRWYRNQSRYLETIQVRAKPYIHFILNELEKRQMPTELALLPAIESAFQPLAYSPGRAAGIWQFIPSTGRICGLKQNQWYDGRRDVVTSTRAALDYLKRLNDMFDGDWELTLAAYNSGAGTVQKAVRKNKANAKPTDYWSLQLPKETSRYVPRLLALSQIFASPEKYGVSLQKIPDEPYFQTVNVGSQFDLKVAAKTAGLTIEEIQQLNPGFTRLTTPPDGPHKLHLPLEKVDGFLEQLAQFSGEKRLRWTRYKVKQGDSLSAIAQNHNISTEALKQANKLQNNTIRAGRHLLVPAAGKQLVASAQFALNPKSRNQNKQPNNSQLQHVVKKGDSLWSVAMAHNVGHKQLAKWNALTADTPLQPGQKLVIHTEKKTGELLSSANLQAEPKQSKVSYKVQQGDSLYRIAERFSVTIPELKKWNSLPGEFLHPGQRIKLYLATEQQTL
jgi:membrane-bound lytic murein transglycosylase D